jgi:hypothetical protein
MTAALFGLLLPAGAAWLSLRAWGLRQPGDSYVMTGSLALLGGLGLSSVTTIWFVTHGITIGPWFVVVDTLLWIAIAAAAWWRIRRESRRRRLPQAPISNGFHRLTVDDWAVRIVFWAIAALALASVIAQYRAAPHGDWDAWAVWNEKARFLFRGGPQWVAMLDIGWTNPGHPMLVSTLVARLWAYAGAESTLVPAVIGLLFGAGVVAVVMSALDFRRKRTWIAGTVLLAPAVFVQQAWSQQADVPVAFFIVSTLILLRHERFRAGLDTQEARASLFLAGVTAGFGAWTKNEGLTLCFIAALIVGIMAVRERSIRPIVWWAVGAAPVLLTVLWYKLVVAPVPARYFSENSTLTTIVWTLLDPHRHAVVSSVIWQRAMEWGAPTAKGIVPLTIAAAVLASATHDARFARAALAAVVVMFASYYLVFMLTSLDVVMLITGSFDRLMTQLWPSLVLAACSFRRQASRPADVDGSAVLRSSSR